MQTTIFTVNIFFHTFSGYQHIFIKFAQVIVCFFIFLPFSFELEATVPNQSLAMDKSEHGIFMHRIFRNNDLFKSKFTFLEHSEDREKKLIESIIGIQKSFFAISPVRKIMIEPSTNEVTKKCESACDQDTLIVCNPYKALRTLLIGHVLGLMVSAILLWAYYKFIYSTDNTGNNPQGQLRRMITTPALL